MLVMMIVLVVAQGCGGQDTPQTTVKPAAGVVPSDKAATAYSPEKIESKYLPNAFRLHANVITGGQPDGDAAFAELEKLGVKTVISVDGAKPDLQLAHDHGLRYVHLPHGYDGVSEQRGLELAKALRDLPGPIYIHCHHGKHRSPAAGAVACVEIGLLSPAEGLAVLEAAGTSPNYRGLYRSVRAARRVDDQRLADVADNVPEVAELPPMAEAMVTIEHLHDHLKALAKEDWKSNAGDPNQMPAHEALLLKEQFVELARTDAAKQQPEAFGKLLAESETAAAQLESALAEPDSAERLVRASAALEQINSRCAVCHKEFRDVPLDEKRAGPH